MNAIKNTVKYIKNLSLCDFGIHKITVVNITGCGYKVANCDKCNKFIML